MIRVLLFGGLQDKAGWREKEIEFCGTIEELRRALEAEHGLAFPAESLLFAIDGAFARAADPIPDGAEVAVMPPVSGG